MQTHNLGRPNSPLSTRRFESSSETDKMKILQHIPEIHGGTNSHVILFFLSSLPSVNTPFLKNHTSTHIDLLLHCSGVPRQRILRRLASLRPRTAPDCDAPRTNGVSGVVPASGLRVCVCVCFTLGHLSSFS